MIPDVILKMEIFLIGTMFRTQSNIYHEFFSENSSFQPLTVFAKKLFIDVWQGSKYASGVSFVSEIMLAIDDFSSSSWFEWKNHEN